MESIKMKHTQLFVKIVKLANIAIQTEIYVLVAFVVALAELEQRRAKMDLRRVFVAKTVYTKTRIVKALAKLAVQGRMEEVNGIPV